MLKIGLNIYPIYNAYNATINQVLNLIIVRMFNFMVLFILKAPFFVLSLSVC